MELRGRGLDAWRTLCNKYMPLANDMQNILIRELMNLKQVSESEVDQLFYDVERSCDVNIKAGSGQDPNLNKWVKACILQNLLDRVVITLALQLKHANSVEEMRSLLTTMLHDHKTGILRGHRALCYIYQKPQTTATYRQLTTKDKKTAKQTIKDSQQTRRPTTFTWTK